MLGIGVMKESHNIENCLDLPLIVLKSIPYHVQDHDDGGGVFRPAEPRLERVRPPAREQVRGGGSHHLDHADNPEPSTNQRHNLDSGGHTRNIVVTSFQYSTECSNSACCNHSNQNKYEFTQMA